MSRREIALLRDRDAAERTARLSTSKQTTSKWFASFPDNILSVDLCDFHSYETLNKRFKYILIAVDVYSKYAWGIPLKTKSVDDIKAAFTKLFTLTEHKPNKICSDHESAVVSLKDWFAEQDIVLYFANGKHGSVPAERFIQTLKQELSYYFTKRNKPKWIDVYQDIIDDYNRHKHRGLDKHTPSEIYNCQESYDEPMEPKKVKPMDTVQKYDVGDTVRFRVDKSLVNFNKKSLIPNYSKDIFKIRRVFDTPKPYSYKLERLTNRRQPRERQYTDHRKEIADANKRRWYHWELTPSNMTAEELNQIPEDTTL